MANDERDCCAHIPWEKMTLKEKVEVLGCWAVYMTKWAEKTAKWQTEFHKSNQEIIKILQDFGDKEDGGGIPPKHPKDPGC